MLLIDKYAYTNKLADYNPMTKFIFVIGALTIVIFFNNPYINMSIFIIMSFLTIFVANIPLNKYLKIMAMPIVFLMISIITILLSISPNDIFISSVKISNKYIGITRESLTESINTLSRVWASISSTFFLALTTPLNNIIKILKKLKLPNVLIELLVLIYRFIFIVLDESKDIIMAEGMKFGYNNMRNSFRSIALLIKSLFIRVLLRYEDMIISLDSKLYNGEFKIGD
ncbi:Cobalt ABC transporter, inner membrane subunit CbiQ [[Clostridium] ultunense Esp]|uniref:Cobalt ABC transporter, inner membrane subunit CbiQ n=1 Tax=[Clostridium] ultunense Esp TaxID=1288971 RepID=M1Z9G5_9FIRM|nr:cobalt ECF transporter T component CbiQ [Schnuerera ultunensis]CCQ94776.1 Cobalt ABC transporter, inner membrane subunit CbiQ [[Clostridium] ultunense Esp]SHD77596.1 Cobalt ABC transporter, inner membrane subunit CbiQ [[Clostridium] ultunense Esp]